MYYDTLGGKLAPIEIINENINENICEESIQKSDRKIHQSKSNSYFVNHHEIPGMNDKVLSKGKLDQYKSSQFHKVYKKNNTEVEANKKRDSLSFWKKLKIEDLLPKNKILSKEDNTIYFMGELYKYATPKSNLSNQLCYRKYFVLDRRYIR